MKMLFFSLFTITTLFSLTISSSYNDDLTKTHLKIIQRHADNSELQISNDGAISGGRKKRHGKDLSKRKNSDNSGSVNGNSSNSGNKKNEGIIVTSGHPSQNPNGNDNTNSNSTSNSNANTQSLENQGCGNNGNNHKNNQVNENDKGNGRKDNGNNNKSNSNNQDDNNNDRNDNSRNSRNNNNRNDRNNNNSDSTEVLACLVEMTPEEIISWDTFNSGNIGNCLQQIRGGASISPNSIYTCSTQGFIDQENGRFGQSLYVFGNGNTNQNLALNLRNVDGSLSQANLGAFNQNQNPGFDDINLLGSFHSNQNLPNNFGDIQSNLNPQISIYGNAGRQVFSHNLQNINSRTSSWGFFNGNGLTRSSSNDVIVIQEELFCKVIEINNNNNNNSTSSSTTNSNSGSGVEIIASNDGNSNVFSGSSTQVVSTLAVQETLQAAAVSTATSSVPFTSSGSSVQVQQQIATAAQDSTPSTTAFQLPGRSLQVLPIGLGIFAAVAVIALVIVGIVTYERRKYRQQFRARKLAQQQLNNDYGSTMSNRMGDIKV